MIYIYTTNYYEDVFRSGERQNPRAKFSHAVSKTSSKQSAEAAELIRLFVSDV